MHCHNEFSKVMHVCALGHFMSFFIVVEIGAIVYRLPANTQSTFQNVCFPMCFIAIFVQGIF